MKSVLRPLAFGLLASLLLCVCAQAQANQPPVAQDDTYTVHGTSTIGSLLANDYDPDGTALSETVLTAPAHGTLYGATPGYKLYQPHTGYTGGDSFTYQVCDGLNACATATVHITVTNARPFGVEDRFVVRGYTTLGPLLANDFDSDNDPLTLGDIQTEQIAVFPQHGTLYGVSNPDIKAYMPSYGYTGTDYFAYNVCDPYGGCTQVGVSLYVFEDGGPRGGPENAGEAPCGASVGEPVNVASGNMYLHQADYRAGDFLRLTRTYNSAVTRAGLFGRGWSSPLDESVTAYDGTLFRVNLADGRGVYFAGQGGVFSPVQTDFRATLIQNGDGTFTLTLKSGEIHRFSATGKLLSVADRNNNQIVLTYDGNNNLAAVTDPYGRVLTVTTDPVYGYATSISDSAGTVASYFYGPSLELTRVEYPDGSLFRFSYAYSTQGPVISEVKDALDNVLEAHTYDGYGRAITSEKHGGVEKVTLDYVNGTETHVTDALGRVTKYFLDKRKGHFVVTRVEGACDCGGGTTSQAWTYDDNLRVLSHTNGLGQTSSYSYDQQGNLISAADAVGQSGFTYNGFGQVLTATDPMGGVTTYTYDAAGNLLTAKNALDKTTTFTYDGRGRLLTVMDARSKVTSFSYDTSSNLTGRTDAANGVTTYAYDARGRLTGLTNALNQTTALEYDAVGRLKKVTAPDSSFVTLSYDLAGRRTAFTDARGNGTSFAYDGANRLTSVTNADNKTTSYGYDLMSNLVSAADPLSRVTNFEYDGYNRLVKTLLPPATTGVTRPEERIEYDAGGRVTKTVDRAGRATSYEYDAANRPVKVIDPALKETQYQYNARSQVTAIIDALNQTTAFTHDALGRVTQVSRGGHFKSFVYDTVGNRTQRTDFGGAVTTYAYDDLNRLTGISYPNSTQVSYTYDALSRLLTATNAEGTVSFAYDSLGRVSSTRDVYGYITSYAYDAAGNRTQMGVGTVPNVAPAQPSATYQYDALDRLTGITDAAGLQTGYGYDAANRRTSRSLPNGVVTTYAYDGLDRLTGLTDTKLLTTLASRQYRYDAAGNITQQTDLAGAHAYGYDALDRLTSATHPASSAEAYGYDAVGNRTSSHRAASYAHQPVSRLASTSAASFSYDGKGNTLSKTEGGGTTNFTWDYEGRLTQAAPPSGPSVTYKYDALGRRVERRLATGEWERFAYDGTEVVRDRASDGTAVEYLNGPGADEKLRQAGAAGVFYYLSDQLGSTTALTDPLGGVVEQLGYDSFGDGAGSTRTRYAYTGRERDEATGLYYYRARWYDPKEGRFLSEDPIGFAAGVNFYAYVGGNPLTRRDPSGLDWLIDILGPAAQVSAGFGDTVSMGITTHVREWMNINHVIIPCSGWYKTGEWMGTAHQVLSAGAGIMEAAGSIAARRAAGRMVREAGEELAKRELPVLQRLCFEAGTPVHTRDGLRPIEEIRKGDRVLSRNEQTGANEYKTVTKVFTREAEGLLDVAVSGEEMKPLGVTAEHPFYVLRARRDLSGEGDSEAAGEWVAAGDLKAGDRVLRPTGGWAEIVSITRRKGRVKVYNFEVADNHNYYVGSTGVLAHNDCPETLHRLGLDRESAGRLGRKAAEAEDVIGIHGVSATAGQPRGPASSALRKAIEEHFPVHNTPTRSDPLHKTIELPKPVTKEVADLFNAIFGRR